MFPALRKLCSCIQCGPEGIMKVFRLLLISLALVVGNSALAYAQDHRPDRDHRDGDHDRDDKNWQNSAAYQDGLKFGRQDAEHHKNNHQQHKRWKSDNDSRAYEAGYNRGYQEGNGNHNDRHDNDGYRNGNGYPNGGYGNRGNVSGNPGYNMGYQDGTNDGRADRQAGRPFKYGPGYNHPDRGYNNSLGDKNTYEQQYRQGYQQAYQQAFGRRG
jgi:hypothetical protein